MTTQRLQTIADALNAASAASLGYNHWEHFESLCLEGGLEADGSKQAELDETAAWSLYAWDDVTGPCGLIVSQDKWVVDE